MKLSYFIYPLLLCASLSAQEAIPEGQPFKPLPPEILKAIEDIGSSEAEFRISIKREAAARQAFVELDKESQDKWKKFINSSSRLAKQKRTAESLFAILEAKSIFADNIHLHNLVGNSYIELRDFPRATAAFKEGVKLQPFNPSLNFNLAESLFVDDQYGKALPLFEYTKKLEQIDPSMKGFRKIIEFKIELCYLGMAKDPSYSKQQQQQYLKKFNTIVDQRNLKDHSLLTYYSKAAQAFSKDDKKTAHQWLKDAFYVFPKRNPHMPWIDTMLEFGFISKIYKNQAMQPEASPSIAK